VPSVGAEGTFVDEHPSVPSHLGWSLGLFLNFAADQIVLRDDNGNRAHGASSVTAGDHESILTAVVLTPASAI
jgi:hypothetical protein